MRLPMGQTACYICLHIQRLKQMKMKDMCLDDRPREKMIRNGAASLSNAELIAILLRTGTGRNNAVETARLLLKMAEGKLRNLFSMSLDRICTIDGIGMSKAVAIAAAMELGRRSAEEDSSIEKVSVTSPAIAYRKMLPHMKGLHHEECWILYLNRANYVIGTEKASSGGLDSTTVDVKLIAKKAIEKLASGIILLHNHPSGNPRPGSADINLTQKLKKALDFFDISLVDHIVVCDDRYYSFADENVASV